MTGVEDGQKEKPETAVFLIVTTEVWTLCMILPHPDLEVSSAVNSSWHWTSSSLLSLMSLWYQQTHLLGPTGSNESATAVQEEGKLIQHVTVWSKSEQRVLIKLVSLRNTKINGCRIPSPRPTYGLYNFIYAYWKTSYKMSITLTTVNHDSCPSPSLPACMPTVSSASALHLSLGSNVLATALLISKPPYKV